MCTMRGHARVMILGPTGWPVYRRANKRLSNAADGLNFIAGQVSGDGLLTSVFKTRGHEGPLPISRLVSILALCSRCHGSPLPDCACPLWALRELLCPP